MPVGLLCAAPLERGTSLGSMLFISRLLSMLLATRFVNFVAVFAGRCREGSGAGQGAGGFALFVHGEIRKQFAVIVTDGGGEGGGEGGGGEGGGGEGGDDPRTACTM